jgi:multidrug efflux pump subunit AcrA (membrane-fusion protein)
MKSALNVLLVVVLMGMSACSKNPSKPNQQKDSTYTVKKSSMHKTLHFNGIIEPIAQTSLISPVDAVVETVVHPFGETVKKGEKVWVLHSAELQKQYNDVLTEYLKAKDNFLIAKAKFSGTDDLWQSGLVSKNAYLSEKSNLDTQQVNLEQSRNRLTALLKKMDSEQTESLSKLNLAEFDKVRRALAVNHQRITLKAPADGLVLYPPKSSDKDQVLSVGAAVKSGQVVALIGDLSGIRVSIDVPEVDIDQIHRGMKATVTGVALGKEMLEGKVVAVNGQAVNSNSGLPSFAATIEVKQLTPEQMLRIRVGMSAMIDISIDQSEALAVPIQAIHQKQGQAMVTVIEKGKHVERPIQTGSAQQDKVVVVSGLKDGEQVVLNGNG